jgi:serine-type D-Ala-D-Ala endopeptidase (penicillin-binding protein 7)
MWVGQKEIADPTFTHPLFFFERNCFSNPHEDPKSVCRKECGMALRFVTAVLVLLFTFSPAVLPASSLWTTPSPRIQSAAAIVQDQRTGQFLLTKQAEIAMPIASITKLMTAMVLLDARLDMESLITIEEADKDTLRHSRSHLPVGARLTRSQALRLALMASENRAAHALARTYPGGIRVFVAAMNEKARSLALADTRFEDPTGLSEGNLSSAHDLSRLVAAACHYPLICSYSTQSEYILQQGQKKRRFVNTNALVRNHRWNIGLSKTGYIEEGGRCLVMQTQLGQRPILIVLLNSSGKNTRIGDAMRIREWIERPAPSRKNRK